MNYPLFTRQIADKLSSHFEFLYGEDRTDYCLEQLHKLLEQYDHIPAEGEYEQKAKWSHRDMILITYGDMIQPSEGENVSKLSKQHEFLKDHLKGFISSVHILPFYPSSSDDGFSVVDYKKVDTRLGGWEDIEAMSKDFRLMADLVMNHTSRHSSWFKKYLKNIEPYTGYFIEVEPGTDLSVVTRPRSSTLLTPVHTENGEKFVWTTFSDDQIDVNFSNPDLLMRYIDIFLFYLSKGIDVVRLDAVAFIWKEIGTSSIHLPKTHEIVKLFRTIVDFYAPQTTIITETNVPHKENLSYFGDGDEAHMVYQFSLPPLLLHAILTENSTYLTEWADSLDKLPENCTYFNFTSSHDGIGVRPLEGLVPNPEFVALVEGMKRRGGFVSEKKNPDGTLSPYELNITYYDAFSDFNGSEEVQEKRYMCSQILMLSLQGVPGIYFHNLTASPNNLEGVSLTGRYRTINRKKLSYDELDEALGDSGSNTHRVFNLYKDIIRKRNVHSAFHPYGKQTVYKVDHDTFCILRENPEENERILVIANLTGSPKTYGKELNDLPVDTKLSYTDILTGSECITNGQLELDPFQVRWIEI